MHMNFYLILGLILSACMGLSLGLIGGGGSIITVPLLVYVMGVVPHQAVGLSLAVVGGTSFVSVIFHSRRGTVNYRSGILVGLLGIVGSLLGSRLTYLLSPSGLMLAFALLMIAASSFMLLRKQPPAADTTTTLSQLAITKAIPIGFIVGLLTGFLGVGGGFLLVPSLVLLGGLAMREAVGTSLLVITINCVAGIIGHWGQETFNWNLMLLVTGPAVLGTITGTFLSHRLSVAHLQKAFAIFTLGIAIFLIVKNYRAFF
jgi:uncharacterized protein